ncbi:MAG: hypothetical protein WCT18_00250 [Patescibacteria group bacterium]
MKAYIIAVDMGYGHQRAAYPLKILAGDKKIINANKYAGIPANDKKIWNQSREAYEFFSRFKKIPILGELAWDLFDKFQTIEPFYPKRDLTDPTIQLKSTYSLIKNKRWGEHLIKKLAQKPLPIICTFFIPAFMAEVFHYPGEIYCLATDTDISRAWAPLNPSSSRIKYLAPNHRVKERLKLYGIKEQNIFVTGFPLPQELVGKKESITKKDLGQRLFNLDPQQTYLKKYQETIIRHIGAKNFPKKKHHPLTLMFAVGGAAAQKELGIEIAKSLKDKIKENKIRLVLVAGIHNDVSVYFREELKEIGLAQQINKNIEIISSPTKEDYFRKFNQMLHQTDILWTKPSELSFYTALGLPIIMSEPIGSQELFNRKWLRTVGSAVNQENPRYTNEWLFDWLDSGWFAEAAMQGFLEATTTGTKNITKVVCEKCLEKTPIKTVLQY